MNILFNNKNDRNFMVVSYYTEHTIYENYIQRLLNSLKKFKLDYYIEGIPALGDWKTATDYKATFILRALRRTPKSIVFIDADGEVVQYPQLFDKLGADVAAFYSHINHLWSGTLFFKNNAKVYCLINDWIKANKKNKILFEQRVLQGVIGRNKVIKSDRLPLSYCKIYDHKLKCKNPVILHYQASRIVKKLNIPSFSVEKITDLHKQIDKWSNTLWEIEMRRIGDRAARIRQEVDDVLNGRKSLEPDPFIEHIFGSSFMEVYFKALSKEQCLTEEEIEDASLYPLKEEF